MKIVVLAVLCCLIPTLAFAKCQNMPTIAFDESESRGVRIVVNGKRWSQSYTNITNYFVMSDCRVVVLGRRGLEHFLAVDNKEWKHSVRNSQFFVASDDQRYLMRIDSKGKIVVNDVVQPPLAVQKANEQHWVRLVDADIDDMGIITTKWEIWKTDGKKETVTATSEVVQ